MKNIKVLFIVFLVLGSCLTVSAQKSDLEKMAAQMFEKTNNRDFGALLDMTYPKVYEFVPKETMKTMFISMFEGTDDMSIDLPKQTPEYKISETFSDTKSKTEFGFLTYDMRMSMTFKKEGFDQEGKDMMVKMFKLQGMDATFENDKKVNVIAKNRMVIFLKNEDSNNKWSMINYDSNSPLFVELLPIKVLEKSKSYYQDVLMDSKKKN